MEQLQKNQSRLDYLWDNFGGRKVLDQMPKSEKVTVTLDGRDENWLYGIYADDYTYIAGSHLTDDGDIYLLISRDDASPRLMQLDVEEGVYKTQSSLGIAPGLKNACSMTFIGDKILISNSSVGDEEVKLYLCECKDAHAVVDPGWVVTPITNSLTIPEHKAIGGAITFTGTLEDGIVWMCEETTSHTDPIKIYQIEIKNGVATENVNAITLHDFYGEKDSATVNDPYGSARVYPLDNGMFQVAAPMKQLATFNTDGYLQDGGGMCSAGTTSITYLNIYNKQVLAEVILDPTSTNRLYIGNSDNYFFEDFLGGNFDSNLSQISYVEYNGLIYVLGSAYGNGVLCVSIRPKAITDDVLLADTVRDEINNLKETDINTIKVHLKTIDSNLYAVSTQVDQIEDLIYPQESWELESFERDHSYGLTWDSNSLDPSFVKVGDRSYLESILDSMYAYQVLDNRVLLNNNWTLTYTGPTVNIVSSGNVVFYLTYEGGETKSSTNLGQTTIEYCLPDSLSVGQTVQLANFTGDYYVNDINVATPLGAYTAIIESQVTTTLPDNTIVKYYPLSVSGISLQNFYDGGTCTAGIKSTTIDLTNKEIAIKIPKFYYKFKEYKGVKSIQVTQYQGIANFPGWKTFDSRGVGAYPCTRDSNGKLRGLSGISYGNLANSLYSIHEFELYTGTHIITLEEYNLIFQWLPLLDIADSFTYFNELWKVSDDYITGKGNRWGMSIASDIPTWRGFECPFNIKYRTGTKVEMNVISDYGGYKQYNIVKDDSVVASSPFLLMSYRNIEDIDFQYTLPTNVNNIEGTGLASSLEVDFSTSSLVNRGGDGICSWTFNEQDTYIRIVYS